ncbi:hypothetical protein MHYP_G00301330 [Metynnis hypsauchen]
MAGIISKNQAKGVDFCGVSDNYIIHSDLGCYMYSTNLHQGKDLTVYSLHPSCQGGDHYLALNDDTFYIIKGNSCRRVSNMSKDLDAAVFDLHPNCRGGDHYLSANGSFYIIFKSRGQWGVQYHKTDNLNYDANANTCSIHPDVLNFLPGGLAETQGPAFGKWDLIKTIANDSETPIKWDKEITRKVGYTKSKTSSIEHNWKVAMSATFSAGTLTEAIVKFQFSVSAEYGGKSVKTDNESWQEANETEESVSLTLQPHKKMYVWQYTYRSAAT